MNVGYKHTPYNYKFFNCSGTVLQYQKVHFFFKSTAQQNFLAMRLHIPEYAMWTVIDIEISMGRYISSALSIISIGKSGISPFSEETSMNTLIL